MRRQAHTAISLLVALATGACDGRGFDRSAQTRSAEVTRAARDTPDGAGASSWVQPPPRLVGREVRAQAVQPPTLLPPGTPPPPG